MIPKTIHDQRTQ